MEFEERYNHGLLSFLESTEHHRHWGTFVRLFLFFFVLVCSLGQALCVFWGGGIGGSERASDIIIYYIGREEITPKSTLSGRHNFVLAWMPVLDTVWESRLASGLARVTWSAGLSLLLITVMYLIYCVCIDWLTYYEIILPENLNDKAVVGTWTWLKVLSFSLIIYISTWQCVLCITSSPGGWIGLWKCNNVSLLLIKLSL